MSNYVFFFVVLSASDLSGSGSQSGGMSSTTSTPSGTPSGGGPGSVTISGVFRPFVEVFLFGPLLSDRKRRATTKSKSGSVSPMFNETFVL